MKNVLKILSVLVVGIGTGVLLFGAMWNVYAEPTPQPYDSDKNLPIGTVVMLNEKNAKKVVPAKYTQLTKMFGVVVSTDSLPITISGGSANEEYIATTGKYKALVTNENGVIKTGDNITLSNLEGTAMKADDKQELVLGKALNSFDGKNNVISNTSLKYDTGQSAKNISIGLIDIAIDIKHNPQVKSTKTKLPPVLERLGEQIAEKELSPFRIYLSVGITVICIIIAVVVLYAGIRNSLISIGRNPLSKKSIFMGLLQIILTSFIILIIGLFTVYLILKL